MEKRDEFWQKMPREGGFKMPDNYLDNITSRVMEQLPEQPEQETVVVSLWTKVRPILYMAAMFMGIALFLNVVKWGSETIASAPEQALLVSPTENSVDELVLYSSMDDYALIEYMCSTYSYE